jgi:hypothetical protein
VLLTYADADFVDDYLSRPLESLTPMTIVDPAVLRKRFDQIRERGWAVTDRDVRPFRPRWQPRSSGARATWWRRSRSLCDQASCEGRSPSWSTWSSARRKE